MPKYTPLVRIQWMERETMLGAEPQRRSEPWNLPAWVPGLALELQQREPRRPGQLVQLAIVLIYVRLLQC